jgi:predicted phage terminase large subunit-like protein
MAVLDRELTAIATGTNDRLIIQMPPRHGKSNLSSVYFPAWYLGRWPHKNIIQIGADDDLARTFSIQARDLLLEHGADYFGTELDPKSQSAGHWKTQAGGGLKASGVGGTIVGFGADVLCIDDYVRNVEAALSETIRNKQYQWFLTTAATRLSPTGSIVVIATRWHPLDLIGCLLRDAEHSGEHWRVVSFPAIDADGTALWPERWPIEKLERIRASHMASGYPWQWEALYQQEPPDILDTEWPAEYFADVLFDEWPRREEVQNRVTALDPSLGKTDKADYSAFVHVVKSKQNYYVDADISRRPASAIVSRGIELLKYWKPVGLGVEANMFQDLLREEFDTAIRRATAFSNSFNAPRVYAIHNHVDKMVRIRMLDSILSRGRVKFKRGSPGVQLLLEQLKGFPSHKYDDGPDALEMAVRLCDKLLKGSYLPLDEGREEYVRT